MSNDFNSRFVSLMARKGRTSPRAPVWVGGWFVVGLITIGLLTVMMGPAGTYTQSGYRGLMMGEVDMADEYADDMAAPKNQVPAATERFPDEGPLAGEVYVNVPVLAHMTADNFNRLMVAITEWVSPEEGCNYCHDPDDLTAERPYTKIVSRRMIEMVQYLNSQWGDHVAPSGVTCWTCHRGNPVPENIWFNNDDPDGGSGVLGNTFGQNAASWDAGLSALPNDVMEAYLVDDQNLRITPTNDLPMNGVTQIGTKQAELTYGMMFHISEGLGVNCTYCHNSQSFRVWEMSPPARVTAWHGIEMTRAINVDYLDPLQPEYPAERLGPEGDAPKANCATCHQGAFKPMYGQNVIDAYPSLAAPAE